MDFITSMHMMIGVGAAAIDIASKIAIIYFVRFYIRRAKEEDLRKKSSEI